MILRLSFDFVKEKLFMTKGALFHRKNINEF